MYEIVILQCTGVKVDSVTFPLTVKSMLSNTLIYTYPYAIITIIMGRVRLVGVNWRPLHGGAIAVSKTRIV